MESRSQTGEVVWAKVRKRKFFLEADTLDACTTSQSTPNFCGTAMEGCSPGTASIPESFPLSAQRLL